MLKVVGIQFHLPLSGDLSETPQVSQSLGRNQHVTPNPYSSKIEWDLTNGPLRKLLGRSDTQVFSGSVQWVLLEISWTIFRDLAQ